jgi:hypothetical protein
MVGVSSSHSPMPVCLMMVRSWSSSSNMLLLACHFPLLVGMLSSSLDESNSCSRRVGGSGSSCCTGLGYTSNWCTSGAGRETYGRPVVRSCPRECHAF